MQGAVLYGPGDLRFEVRAAPTITKPTDAIIRISVTCVFFTQAKTPIATTTKLTARDFTSL
jgi:hypothetical protein